MFPFSFSLSHTLTVFLSIFFELHLQLKLSLFCVLLSLELTHNGQEWLSISALLTWPNGLCFPSFLLCQFQGVSHAQVTAQGNGMLTLEHFSLREVRPLHALVTSQ